MSETPHTARAFDEALRAQATRIALMGDIAQGQLTGAMAALLDGDTGAAEAIVADDARLDRLERDVEAAAIELIAARHPVADDLRRILAAAKIATILERIGDHAKSVARRVAVIAGERPAPAMISRVEVLARLVEHQLAAVLEALAASDMFQAMEVWRGDDEIDETYTSLFRDMLTYMMEDAHNIAPATHILFCAKNIERIGDHATNIAEIIHYQMTGIQSRMERPKGDLSSSLTASPEV